MMRAVEAHSCRRHSPAGQCGAPFFCALDALAINDRSARAGVPPRQLPACHIERVVNAPERAVVVPSVEVVGRVLRGGRSLGIAAHWQPVLRIYMRPLTTSRRLTVRLLPPRLAAGINGATSAHSASVKSLG